jgi:hypothetical protein
VGVAADARNSGLTDGNNPEYYLVRRRGAPEWIDAPANTAVVVRGGPPAGMEALLRSEIAALDPGLPTTVRSFDRHVGSLAAGPRFHAWLLAGFAATGLLLAAFGLYGLVAFLTAQREREFGVRLALGASPRSVVMLMLAEALRWTLGGVALGVVGAAASAHAIRGLLFHVSPANPAPYAIAALILGFVALAAALLASRRAARLDPAVTLRAE